MANPSTHRLAGLKPGQVLAVVEAESASPFSGTPTATLNSNPENIVSSVARTAEGVVTVTLASKWAACEAVHVSLSIDDYTVTIDSKDVSSAGTVVFTTRTGAADADADGCVFTITLVLRTQ